MFVGIGIGIGRQRFAGSFSDSYSERVLNDGGTIEALSCVANASTLLQQASILFIPSGYKAGVLYNVNPQINPADFVINRNSVATRVQSDGSIGSVAINVPRLSYMYGSCPAYLSEPQRTNEIHNSTLSGAVAGSPGTMPTNYNFGTSSGLTKSIVNVGVENGLNFIDIRFQGTATGIIDILNTTNAANASSGQIWSHSIYTKLVSGSVNNLSLAQVELTSTGVYVIEGSQLINPTSTLTRYSLTRTLNGGASTALVTTSLYFIVTIGQTYDYVVRIAQMQMELGSYITAPILTIANASSTRNVDQATKSGLSSILGQTQGTVFFDMWYNRASNAGFRSMFAMDGTNQGMVITTGTTNNSIQYAGLSYALPSDGRHKVAVIYDSVNNVSKLFVNGVLRGTGTFSAFTSTMDRISLGGRWNSATSSVDRQTNAWFQVLAVYNSVLSDANCITLTT
jgi:hypothetical protein